MTNREISNVALAEITAGTLGTTAQFFAVHRLAKDEPVSCVWPTEDCWLVYLKLEGEPYFWVSRVEPAEGSLRVTAGFPSPLANVALTIYSDNLPPEEISAALSLQPSEALRKGAPLLGRSPMLLPRHVWNYRPSCPDSLDMATKLSTLLAELAPHAEKMRLLRSETEQRVSVGYYEFRGWPSGWHLCRGTLAELASLGLELDVDLYVSGPELPE